MFQQKNIVQTIISIWDKPSHFDPGSSWYTDMVEDFLFDFEDVEQEKNKVDQKLRSVKSIKNNYLLYCAAGVSVIFAPLWAFSIPITPIFFLASSAGLALANFSFLLYKENKLEKKNNHLFRKKIKMIEDLRSTQKFISEDVFNFESCRLEFHHAFLGPTKKFKNNEERYIHLRSMSASLGYTYHLIESIYRDFGVMWAKKMCGHFTRFLLLHQSVKLNQDTLLEKEFLNKIFDEGVLFIEENAEKMIASLDDNLTPDGKIINKERYDRLLLLRELKYNSQKQQQVEKKTVDPEFGVCLKEIELNSISLQNIENHRSQNHQDEIEQNDLQVPYGNKNKFKSF